MKFSMIISTVSFDQSVILSSVTLEGEKVIIYLFQYHL